MTKDVIEHYDTLKAKWCPYELLFGNFNDQPFPPGYYEFLNKNNENGNNNPGTTVDDVFPDNEGVEYSVMPNATNVDDNGEENGDEIEDDDDADSDNLEIDSLQDYDYLQY